MRTTKVVGHKGASGYAPENTLLSFSEAIKVGCPRTELDARLTKDGVVVVIHDSRVDRTTDGTGAVAEMTLEEIKKLNCSQGQKIPTLQEVINLCKEKIALQIELKAQGTPQKVDELIRKNGMEKEALITSFEAELLREMKKINPCIEAGLLFKKYAEQLWKMADEIPLDYICPKADIVSEKMISHAHALKLKVYAYHVNDAELGLKLISWGIDDIGTDFPKKFLENI